MNSKTLIAIFALLIVAAGGWFFLTQRTPVTASAGEADAIALQKRAEAACLSSLDSKAGTGIEGTAKPADGGATVGAGVSASESIRRGAPETIAEAERVTENNNIRACIADYLERNG